MPSGTRYGWDDNGTPVQLNDTSQGHPGVVIPADLGPIPNLPAMIVAINQALAALRILAAAAGIPVTES